MIARGLTLPSRPRIVKAPEKAGFASLLRSNARP
jgi:hypothetical protein